MKKFKNIFVKILKILKKILKLKKIFENKKIKKIHKKIKDSCLCNINFYKKFLNEYQYNFTFTL